jgi:cytochrome c oxidase subunit 2
MAFAIVLILLVVVSVLFHVLSPWQATEAASNWGSIDAALFITLLITGAFFVASRPSRRRPSPPGRVLRQ